MRLLRTFTVALGLGGFAMAAGGASCNPVSDFQCATDEDCVAQGEGGVCETNSFCTFPDLECPSSKRWHDRASSLAGMCFGEGTTTATDTDDPTMASSEGSSTGSSTGDDPTVAGDSTSTGDGMTTDPLTTGDPTTGDPTTSGSSSSSGSGGAMMCDEMYGAATDYVFCEESEEECSFSVTTANAASCTMVCESFGGTCVSAADNSDDPCVSVTDTTCDDDTLGNLICTCSL